MIESSGSMNNKTPSKLFNLAKEDNERTALKKETDAQKVPSVDVGKILMKSRGKRTSKKIWNFVLYWYLFNLFEMKVDLSFWEESLKTDFSWESNELFLQTFSIETNFLR